MSEIAAVLGKQAVIAILQDKKPVITSKLRLDHAPSTGGYHAPANASPVAAG